MEKSESIKELATALCKFQGAVETIKKESTNPFFKSQYANLSSILDVIRQPLAENGLSFVQFPINKNGLETMLMHTSGEWMASSYEMTPTKNDPQGLGSVITYQRRYALGAILGLNIDIDDDGNKGSEPVKVKAEKPAENQPLTELQIAIYDMQKTKSLEDVKTVYLNFPNLKEDKEFVRETNRQKAKYENKK